MTGMIGALFNTLLYEPFYNTLILLLSVVPGHDAGFSVILLTLLVKLALFSLSYKSIKGMVKQRALEPEVARIREQHKSDSQAQAMAVMAFYKKNGVNPFAGLLVVLIQIPVILALYWVFLRSGLPTINGDLLYSFIHAPESINMIFLGIFDLSQKSILMALAAGVTQYIQALLLTPPVPANQTSDGARSFKDDLAHSLQLQMKYVLPIVVAIFAYTLPAAIGLYWTTSNLFAIGQEFFVRKRLTKDPTVVTA
jgi:YidC/Oxa1 family membrane protein insertase